jgi:hypothetical protein
MAFKCVVDKRFQVFWDVMPCLLVNSYQHVEDLTFPQNVGNYYKFTWCNIIEDMKSYQHYIENLKCHISDISLLFFLSTCKLCLFLILCCCIFYFLVKLQWLDKQNSRL